MQQANKKLAFFNWMNQLPDEIRSAGALRGIV